MRLILSGSFGIHQGAAGANPVLSKALDGESLLLYLFMSESAVSAVLTKVEGTRHAPVYYISKGVLPAEGRYAPMEKLILVLITAARKLRPYFQSHPIIVVTEHPILHKPELSRRMVKLAVELSEHNISYKHRSAVKAQALADFIADFTPMAVEP